MFRLNRSRFPSLCADHEYCYLRATGTTNAKVNNDGPCQSIRACMSARPSRNVREELDAMFSKLKYEQAGPDLQAVAILLDGVRSFVACF